MSILDKANVRKSIMASDATKARAAPRRSTSETPRAAAPHRHTRAPSLPPPPPPLGVALVHIRALSGACESARVYGMRCGA